MAGLEFNDDAIERFKAEVEERLSGEIVIPGGGSEDDAVRSVVRQLEDRGLVPDEDAIRRAVRGAREGTLSDE